MEQIILHPVDATYTKEDSTTELIDLRIIDCYEKPDYQYQLTKNALKYYFKSNPSKQDFVQIIYKDLNGDDIEDIVTYTITGLYLYNSETGENILIEKPMDSIPIINENIITYKNIFSGADLIFTANSDKLKETIILNEDITALIPDPVSLGHNPETCNVVIGVEISFNGKLIETDDQKIVFQNQGGNANLFITPVTAKSKTEYVLTQYLFQKLDTNTGDYLYGISYITTQKAVYPIEIDPTITAMLSNSGTINSYYSDADFVWYYTLITGNAAFPIGDYS